MKTALVLTTYNSPRSLGICLKSFANQTRKDFDIHIADDGSTEETRAKIDSLRPLFTQSIRHHWHADEGYRKAKINNDVFRELGEYDVVICVDADTIADHRFVEDHLAIHEGANIAFARRMMFMGRRIDLGPWLTQRVTEGNVLAWNSAIFPPGLLASYLKGETANLARAVRVTNPLLQKLIRRDHVGDLLGSNYSISRELLWEVNGYDEDFKSYWGEDGDLFVRVRNSGAKLVGLKSYALQYHLHHKRLEPKREHEEIYEERLRNPGYRRCANGIFKAGTMKKMEFRNIGEIRMASPHNGATLFIDGQLISDGAQDVGYLSPNGTFCLFSEWCFENVNPGFKIAKVLPGEPRAPLRRLTSKRFSGCLRKLDFSEEQDAVVLQIWEYEKDRMPDECVREEKWRVSQLFPKGD